MIDSFFFLILLLTFRHIYENKYIKFPEYMLQKLYFSHKQTTQTTTAN